ncbi:hypothetical protein OOJ91_33555 [Micromonospora lupini]|uniref:hypothetical protein n=1 Tax=Micromonospora lupini TaxID=285679 RepID=UPI002253F34E|nr:hypothetical protein [Micromonospora lupini]MCX5070773.1 hypothetical protein [Micromonospora lupini]
MSAQVDLATLRKQLAAALRRRDPADRAMYAEVVAADAAVAHRDVLQERDVVAAALHVHHDWPISRIEGALRLGAKNREPLRAALAENTNPPNVAEPAAKLAELAELGRELHTLRQDATEAAGREWEAAKASPLPPVEGLPDVPEQRVEAIGNLLRTVRADLARVVKMRNQAAAGMVSHRGWPTVAAARIAGTSGTRLDETPPAPDSPALRDELLRLARHGRSLTAKIASLEAEQRRLARQVPAQVRTEPVTDVPVAQLRRKVAAVAKVASPEDRAEKADELAKELYDLRRQVIVERTAAAGHLHVHEGRPLAQLVEVISPGSRNQSQLRTQIDRLGAAPAKVPNAEQVLADRAEVARAITELLSEVRALRG